MKVVCAWCQKILEDDATPNAEVSHGICRECRMKLMGEATTSLGDFLNDLAFPVLATDGDRLVLAANHAAEELLGKSASRLTGDRVGMAIECYYAGMPGGCGKTAQCRGCALRQNIADTYADGRPRYGVYVEKRVVDGPGSKMVQFKFSTQKVKESVVLLIEQLKEMNVDA
ncbi:MAG TPA: PAS domain-containing protein [Opitutaceae bacterium]|nr:PAS domain-containing protein [Opitutaceae bacterium]